MKTSNQILFKATQGTTNENATANTNTAAENKSQKNFRVVDLWNIHRKSKQASSRRNFI